ncbi:hypothetical protein AX14_012697 [Amanita brunnescens Koide BX004]|nr:hypothetical protein AX14_012697 [Amanita brunnescens Koide BX004]
MVQLTVVIFTVLIQLTLMVRSSVGLPIHSLDHEGLIPVSKNTESHSGDHQQPGAQGSPQVPGPQSRHEHSAGNNRHTEHQKPSPHTGPYELSADPEIHAGNRHIEHQEPNPHAGPYELSADGGVYELPGDEPARQKRTVIS